MNTVNVQEATISQWVHDINIYTYNNIKYWIHKIPVHDNWVMTNFNFDLTNIDLKTTDLRTAEQRATVMMRTKNNALQNAINTLTVFTKVIRRKSIQLSPSINKSLIDFTSKLRQYHNV